MKKAVTAIYSAAHFFVDMSCAFVMLKFAYMGDPTVILIYNFCAFALQMPIGIILDSFGGGRKAAALGCGLVALSFFLPVFQSSIITAVTAGLGNALFHVGGGVYVLNEFKGAAALGIFVSPGAIGLYLGTLMSKTDAHAVFPVISMLAFAALIFIMPYIFNEKMPEKYADKPFSVSLPISCKAAAAMFFAVVIIRSFGGFAVSFPWKVTGAASLAAVIFTAAGKAAGGFISDKFGMERAAAVTMTAAGVTYLFSGNMAAGLTAVFLFNMSMPVTLKGAADILDGGKGFSFGLLTFALFIGYIPSYTGNANAGVFAMCILCLVSAVLLTAGFAVSRKGAVSCDRGGN